MYNNNEISVFAGIGFNTLAEIIGRLKTYYGLHLTFEKGPTLQEKKMPRKQQIKKKPSSDDFGRMFSLIPK
jgi:hypothetical protein